MVFGVIAVSWFLSFGYVPLQENTLYGRSEELPSDRIATAAEVGIKARFENLTVFGSIENYQYVGTGANTGYFYPYRADYKAGASLKVSEGVTINVTHECDHPVVSYQSGKAYTSFLSGETIVSVRFEGGEK